MSIDNRAWSPSLKSCRVVDVPDFGGINWFLPSGIGTTAIQMASALGACVFATAGSAEKCAVCEKLGAERAINQVFPLEEVAAAHKMLASGEVIGKLVLSVQQPGASSTDTGAHPK